MLLLVEGEEKECLPKFGVPIFILAHKLNKFYSLSWKHCIKHTVSTAMALFIPKVRLRKFQFPC